MTAVSYTTSLDTTCRQSLDEIQPRVIDRTLGLLQRYLLLNQTNGQ